MLAITDEATERGLTLLQRMSPEVALFGHGAMSDLSPLSGVKRKLDFGAVRSAFDPLQTLAARQYMRVAPSFSITACTSATVSVSSA